MWSTHHETEERLIILTRVWDDLYSKEQKTKIAVFVSRILDIKEFGAVTQILMNYIVEGDSTNYYNIEESFNKVVNILCGDANGKTKEKGKD